MMKYLLIMAILLLGVVGYAQNKSVNIAKGNTFSDMSFTAADTINESETYYIEVTNRQDFPQQFDIWVDIDSVSGSPNVTITVYGKKFSGDTYASIGTAVTWAGTADTTFNYPINTVQRYRYIKVEFVASATDQQSLVSDVQVKGWYVTSPSGDLSEIETITLENGLTIDNAVDNKLEINENSDELIYTFGSNTITVSSGDVTAFNYSSMAVDVDGALTAGSVASDATVSGTTITASTGFALGDGDYIGVTSNEIVTFATAGTVAVEGANFDVGTTSADDVQPALAIRGDADSDAGGDTDEAFTIDLTPNATPTSALWEITSTQSAGYTFDKEVTFKNNAASATFGAIATDADVVLNFDAVTAQGSITYMEDEDRFDFDNDVDVIGDLTAATVVSDGAVSGTAITGSAEANFTNNAAAATFGAAATDADVVLAFDAVTAQGSITYMEDEDRFDFDNDVDVIGDLTAATITSDGAITATSGVDLGTSQALVGTTAMTIGDGTQTAAINSSDWDVSTTGNMTGIGTIQTQSNVGSVGEGGTVTAAEYGDGFHHITVLTLTNFVVGTPNAGNNLAIGDTVYTFPAGAHVHQTTYSNIGLTAGTVQTDTPDVGIGSVIGSGAVATLDGTPTFEDYITGQTWASTLDGTAEIDGPAGAVAGVLTGISLNGASDSKNVCLNAADGWNAGITGNLTASGTIILIWDFLE